VSDGSGKCWQVISVSKWKRARAKARANENALKQSSLEQTGKEAYKCNKWVELFNSNHGHSRSFDFWVRNLAVEPLRAAFPPWYNGMQISLISAKCGLKCGLRIDRRTGPKYQAGNLCINKLSTFHHLLLPLLFVLFI
jgi:hypothetical protein